VQKGVERRNNVPRNYLSWQKYFRILSNFDKLYKYWKYNVEEFLYEAAISQHFSIFKILYGIFGVFIDLKTAENLTSDRNFLKMLPRSQKVKNFLHLWTFHPTIGTHRSSLPEL
jgi:hypothetical protein